MKYICKYLNKNIHTIKNYDIPLENPLCVHNFQGRTKIKNVNSRVSYLLSL